MWRWLRRMVIGIPLTLAAALVVVYLALPWPLVYRWEDPSSTSFMRHRQREARQRGETLEIRHAWVPLERISEPMRRAVVLAEDGRFREHGGVDWTALGEELEWEGGAELSWTDPADLRALAAVALYYWRNRDDVRGRSTITQQLAKNLYFTPERSLARKLGEFVVAKRLERFLDKDRILELYLNTVELGPGLFGVEAAAGHYFGTSAAELTPWQAASLAATLPHPLTSNPETRPGRMAWRRDLILGRMSGRDGGRSPVPVAPGPVDAPDVEVEPPEVSDPPGEGPPKPGDTGAAGEEPEPGPPEPTSLPDPPPPDAPPGGAPPDTAGPPPSDSLGDPRPRTGGRVQGTELAPPSPRR